MFAFWLYFLFFVSVHFFNKYTVAAADALQIFGAEKRGEVENFDIKKKQSQDEMEHSIFGTFRLPLRHDQSMKNHNVWIIGRPSI